ncbi:MAG TPA: dual specificity protein phosphatase family protein [Candidatus Saccharimonadales bacterium]|nr:dual specificity protein phosphatase family protein [Candidatus Saccharimonadales bacterium]
MIEVYPRLFIGTEFDYESQTRSSAGWWVVHACKEPYHRQLLGYAGRAAPKTHPEYLFARRERRLYLNIVDADDPNYIPKEIIDGALTFIEEGMRSGEKVLIHCNQGESRSPSIGLLYLAARTNGISSVSLPAAETDFRRLYPRYNPKAGMRGFLLRHWNDYVPSSGAKL